MRIKELFEKSVVKITDSAAFKSWFGKSVVVDHAGEPLVLYKAMYPYDWTKEKGNYKGPEIDVIERPSDFPAFHKDEPGIKIAGFFGDKETANRFANLFDPSAIYPVYLKMLHPYVVDADGKKAAQIQFGETGKDFRDAVRSGRFDGVIIRNTADEGTIYVALKPENIKSAIGNNGKFDSGNKSISETI